MLWSRHEPNSAKVTQVYVSWAHTLEKESVLEWVVGVRRRVRKVSACVLFNNTRSNGSTLVSNFPHEHESTTDCRAGRKLLTVVVDVVAGSQSHLLQRYSVVTVYSQPCSPGVCRRNCGEKWVESRPTYVTISAFRRSWVQVSWAWDIPIHLRKESALCWLTIAESEPKLFCICWENIRVFSATFSEWNSHPVSLPALIQGKSLAAIQQVGWVYGESKGWGKAVGVSRTD